MRFLLLLLLHFTSAYYFEQSSYDAWRRNCGRRNSESIHWYVALKNTEIERSDGAVVITPKHVLTSRKTVSDQHGNPMTPDNLKVVLNNNNTKVKIPQNEEGKPRYRIETSPEYGVARVTVPTSSQDPKENIFSLAIVELSEDLPDIVVLACITRTDYPSPILPHGATVQVTYEDLDNYRKSREIKYYSSYRDCKDYACEVRLEAEPYSPKVKLGSAWYNTIDGRDVVYGIDLGGGTAISIPFWADFLCKQLGTCMHGYNKQSDEKNSDFAVFIDGVYHPYSKVLSCQNDYRAAMIREASPLTRLNRLEQRMLKQKCGTTADYLPPHSYLVTLVSEQDDDSLIKCAGVLITPLHVLSSLSCVKTATVNSGQLVALFLDNKEDVNEQFPFESEDFHTQRYNPSQVGKRWIRVARFVAPHGNPFTEDYDEDLALVQLQRKIPLDSYIKPICLSQNVLVKPQFDFARIRETMGTDGYFTRAPILENFHTHDSIGFANCSTHPDACWAFRFRMDKELGLEERGGALVDQEIVGDKMKKMLIGVVSKSHEFNQGGFLVTAIRTQYFSTFICIHTGLCADGETFTKRLFTAFDNLNFRLPHDIVSKEWALHREKKQYHLEWKQVDNELKSVTRALSKQAPYYYYKQQNEELQHECGKKPPRPAMKDGTNFTINEHPWPVFLARANPLRPFCTASLLSRRYAITARHCIDDFLEPRLKYQIAVGDVNFIEHRDKFTMVNVKKVINVATDVASSDIAILELEKDIQVHPVNFLCLPRRSEEIMDSSLFDPVIYHFGGGYRDEDGPLGLLQYRTIDSRDPNAFLEPNSRVPNTIFLSYRNPDRNPQSRGGDSGGPIVRRRLSDDRFVLIGVHKGRNGSETLPLNSNVKFSYFTSVAHFLDDICKFTGICPDGDYRKDKVHEVEVNGVTVCADMKEQ